MTFHLKFISILTASVLTGVLVYGTSGMQDFQYWNSLWCTDSVKSKSVHSPGQKKTVSKDSLRMKSSAKNSNPDFTFFDTLMDTQLVKQVGLDGKLTENHSPVSISLPPTDSQLTGPVPKAPDPPIMGSLAGKDIKSNFQTPSEFSEVFDDSEDVLGSEKGVFLVQVASFKSLDHAQTMVRKFKKKGFDAFLQKTISTSGNNLWYRVYLGRFKEKGKALKMVFRVKNQERLNPIVVLRVK